MTDQTPSTEDVLTWAVIREYVGEGMREHPITDADARALRRCGDEPEAKIADAWLAARDREVAAKAWDEAWDEGYSWGRSDAAEFYGDPHHELRSMSTRLDTPNPYEADRIGAGDE